MTEAAVFAMPPLRVQSVPLFAADRLPQPSPFPRPPAHLVPLPVRLFLVPQAFVMRDKKERMIDYTVAQDKAKQLQNNRDSVEKRYRSKFANSDEAMQWETAPLRRWYG